MKTTTLEHTKHVVDAMSISSIAAAFVGYLPELSAGAGLIWTLIRIYETKTVKGLLYKLRKKNLKDLNG